MPTLITIDQFKKMYGVSRSTVYRLRERGLITFIHIGRSVRIRTEDADNWYRSLLEDAGCT